MAKNDKEHFDHVVSLLTASDSSVRLKTAMACGTEPHPDYLEPLVERCGTEPDFFVREMLTWAIVRLPREITVSRVIKELDSAHAQARSQALHTLSKIHVPEAWDTVFPRLVADSDNEVARAAWRVAVDIVPQDEVKQLAQALIEQLGRGEIDVKKSLARAFVVLETRSPDASAWIEAAIPSLDREQKAQAMATLTLIEDPQASFEGVLSSALQKL